MKVLLIDNYDSFTYNLFHLLEQYNDATVTVKRNDDIDMSELGDYNAVVISPGPGLPSESHALMDLTRFCVARHKVLGVCLGHQAVAEEFGATQKNPDKVFHGVAFNTKVTDPSDPLFRNLPENFMCGRYHSWLVNPNSLPDEIRVTAIDDEQNIMAIKHVHLPVWGIQFHPESILTEFGKDLIFNWMSA